MADFEGVDVDNRTCSTPGCDQTPPTKAGPGRPRLYYFTCKPHSTSVSKKPLAPCGTFAAYQRHLKRGETACRPCKDAANVYAKNKPSYKAARAAAKAKPVVAPALRQCSVDGCEAHYYGKGFCRRHWQAQWQRVRPRFVITCEICGSNYEHTSPHGRFCSIECRNAHQHPPACRVYYSQCLNCEAWFSRRKPGTLTCSPKCLSEATRRTVMRAAWTPRETECAWCGETFPMGHPSHGYCSKKCSRKASKLRRRAREHGAVGTYRLSDFMRMARRFDYRCAYCGDKPGQLDPDHVVPLSRGGDNAVTNLLPSCRPCNADKRDLLLHEWDVDRIARNLPPRSTTWAPEDARYRHLTSVLGSPCLAA